MDFLHSLELGALFGAVLVAAGCCIAIVATAAKTFFDLFTSGEEHE